MVEAINRMSLASADVFSRNTEGFCHFILELKYRHILLIGLEGSVDEML